MLHCDLKPSSILLDNDLTAQVGDFGLAKILLAASGESFSTDSSSICIRGTIGYVAPGQILSNYPSSYSFTNQLATYPIIMFVFSAIHHFEHDGYDI